MPTVTDQQMATRLQAAVQIEARHTSRRSDAWFDPDFVERNQDRRTMILFDDSTGDDPDHAGMPTTIGQDQRRIALRIEKLLRCLLAAR